MYVHTILPTKKSAILVPSYLVQNEMGMKIGKEFLGTIFYSPQNPSGFNTFDPTIRGSVIGLIQQILSTTNDYVLLFESGELLSKLDYYELGSFPGIDRVFIVNIGDYRSPIEKEFLIDFAIFEQYFKKDEPPVKKRWLLSVDVIMDENSGKKQKFDEITPKERSDTPSVEVIGSFLGEKSSGFIPLLSPTEGKRTPYYSSNFWEEKDITKIAWTEEIIPDQKEKLPPYKIHGIQEIRNMPVPFSSKSHLICSYSNGNIYMNNKTRIQKSDYYKISEMISLNKGRKVYAFNKIVGYYDTVNMVYHHY